MMNKFRMLALALGIAGAGPACAQYGLVDGGFDTQGSSVTSFCIFNSGGCPSGAWTGDDSGFIHGQNASWANPAPLSGSTVGLVQGPHTLSQTFSATGTATVRLTWYDSNRPSGYGGQTYTVTVNGNVVATFSPTSTPFVRRYSSQFIVQSGTTYTVAFNGQNNADETFFIDNVAIELASETTNYSYDPLGRLTGTTHSGPVSDNVATGYRFDNADNRTQATVTGSPNQ